MKLLLHLADAFDPVEAGDGGVDVHESAVEVVDDGQQVDDEGDVGDAGVLAALFFDAALEVLVIGGGALPVGEVSLGLLALFFDESLEGGDVVRQSTDGFGGAFCGRRVVSFGGHVGGVLSS